MHWEGPIDVSSDSGSDAASIDTGEVAETEGAAETEREREGGREGEEEREREGGWQEREREADAGTKTAGFSAGSRWAQVEVDTLAVAEVLHEDPQRPTMRLCCDEEEHG